MDANTPSNASSDAGRVPESYKSAGFAGAFFPHSRHLRVTGGTFTSQVHIQNTVQSPREHFKWIGRGEIDLQREIHLDDNLSMTSGRRHGALLYRMFSAKIREETQRNVVNTSHGTRVSGIQTSYKSLVFLISLGHMVLSHRMISCLTRIIWISATHRLFY
ncbi:hypothetical protein FB45DRAFT_366424 [Roridomyces roridus]|uniref:Uncharacterized protein n=1 Tax=Roridomyces roridus TaxID=1738132 RepID=A0AAD7FX11_9AGAR|nr:hypothetical protein FB45DRAFT_366424 [Roridomyces roridus]